MKFYQIILSTNLKTEYNKLFQSAVNSNELDLVKIKELNAQKKASNLDQIYTLIEEIEKRNLVLQNYDSKFKPLQYDDLDQIKKDLAEVFLKIGDNYINSTDKLDAIVSYKSYKKAVFLNPVLNLDHKLKQTLANGQTKIFLSFKDSKSRKSDLKILKEILNKDEDPFIVFTDKKDKSDVEVLLDLKNINQQSYLVTHLRNGASVNDVIHKSYDVEFNGYKGFGKVNTNNFSTNFQKSLIRLLIELM